MDPCTPCLFLLRATSYWSNSSYLLNRGLFTLNDSKALVLVDISLPVIFSWKPPGLQHIQPKLVLVLYKNVSSPVCLYLREVHLSYAGHPTRRLVTSLHTDSFFEYTLHATSSRTAFLNQRWSHAFGKIFRCPQMFLLFVEARGGACVHSSSHASPPYTHELSSPECQQCEGDSLTSWKKSFLLLCELKTPRCMVIWALHLLT